MKKIKVLHLTTHLNVGGITTYIRLLARAMQAEGSYEVIVCSSGGAMVPQFREMGIQTYEVPFRTKSELSPKLYWAIPKVIDLV